MIWGKISFEKTRKFSDFFNDLNFLKPYLNQKYKYFPLLIYFSKKILNE